MCVCVCVYHIFTHLSVNGHLGCFQALPVVNSRAMWFFIQQPGSRGKKGRDIQAGHCGMNRFSKEMTVVKVLLLPFSLTLKALRLYNSCCRLCHATHFLLILCISVDVSAFALTELLLRPLPLIPCSPWSHGHFFFQIAFQKITSLHIVKSSIVECVCSACSFLTRLSFP